MRNREGAWWDPDRWPGSQRLSSQVTGLVLGVPLPFSYLSWTPTLLEYPFLWAGVRDPVRCVPSPEANISLYNK